MALEERAVAANGIHPRPELHRPRVLGPLIIRRHDERLLHIEVAVDALEGFEGAVDDLEAFCG